MDTNLELEKILGHQEFAKTFNQTMLEKSTLIKSGIAVPDPVISAKIAEGSGLEGKTLDMDSLDSLDNAGDAEVPVEKTGVNAEGVTSTRDTAVVQFRRKKFAVTDIQRIMRSADPYGQIISQQVPYWDKQNQKIFLAMMTGIFGANALKARVSTAGESDAENSTNGYKNGCDGDMILDLTKAASDSAKFIDKSSIMLAAQILGDHKNDLAGVAMHSSVATYLSQLDGNNNTFYKPSELGNLAKYNGRDIIEDDTIPVDANGVATIYLFGKGCVAYNPLPCPHPFEHERDADKAVDYIHAWVREILHLRGWKWQGTMSGLAPTNQELATAASWKRVWDKKRIPCVMLKGKIA